MGLLKGLMINQGPAEARISPERGLYWAERRRGDGCYSMGWAGALSGENGRDRRGGRAGRYPTGRFLPATISAYFRRTCSYRTDLGTYRGLCPSD